ncbi:hypothetical protein A9Q02_07365 [Candidatus Chloroploca asiatica]|uniref:Major facilitator superfamily (MFS) profile domain-containing protein n=2 Tax=Candidatus Chloroploca asiatica TaxID=1506545 RepID=A0A2H3KZW2_9CHLR|nr:hypothetical protein A9Q02_07365 [Candidatus Chloroploca asiatica]
MGVRQTFGVFLIPISETLEIGRSQVSFTLAVQNLIFGLGQPFIGALADRRGVRPILMLGVLLYALGLWGVTVVSNVWGLLFALGLVVGLAQSMTTFVVIFSALGALVPTQRRGLAFGLVTAGGSLGMFAFVPLAQILLSMMSWQGALVSLALLILLILLFALAFRRPTSASSQAVTLPSSSLKPVLATAFRHPGYLLLNLGFFVCGFHVAFIAIHFPAYLADYAVAPFVAASALAVIGLANVVGSYLFGSLSDRFVKKRVLSGLYFARAVVFVLFLLVPVTGTSALVFGFAIGLLWLGTVPLTSGLVAQLFGVRYLGTLYGIVFLSHQVGAFLGAWLGGAVYDVTGSYLPVWYTALALSLVAAFIHVILDDRPVRGLQEQRV